MSFSKMTDWGGVFGNSIMKHHMTGRHSDHIVPVYIGEENEDLIAAYNECMYNDYEYEELDSYGDGDIPYLFQTRIAGQTGYTGTYDYILNLNDVSKSEYERVAKLYGITPQRGPSKGFYPDIRLAIVLITAAQLNISLDQLSPENAMSVADDIIIEAVSEVYEDDFEDMLSC